MNKNLIYALCSGVMLSFAWLDWSTPFFLFIALVPLLLIMECLSGKSVKHPYWKMFGFSLLAFVLWNLADTWWIAYATSGGMIGAVLFNSLMAACVMTLSLFVQRRRGWNIALIFFFSLWVSYEYLTLRWDLNWSWLNLGNGFLFYRGLIQWYEYTGTFGGTMWVLASNIALFKCWLFIRDTRCINIPYIQDIQETGTGGDTLKEGETSQKEDCTVEKRRNQGLLYRSLAVTAALIVVPMILSGVILMRYKTPAEQVQGVAVQPNLDPYEEKYHYTDTELATQMVDLADTLMDSSVRIVAGPEISLHNAKNLDSPWANGSLDTLRALTEKYPGAIFVTGASFVRYYTDEKVAAPSANKMDGANGYSLWYDLYNSAVGVDTSSVAQFYHKSRFVPGAEMLPFRKLLKPILGDVVIELGGLAGSHSWQEHASLIYSPDSTLRIAPLVCYESIFGDYTTEFTREGANMICIITQDSWWKQSQGHKQLLALGALRAIENRMGIIRSASTGISAFIDPAGRVTGSLAYGHKGAIRGDISLNNGTPTIYAQYGDYLPKPFLWLSLGLVVFSLLYQKKKLF